MEKVKETTNKQIIELRIIFDDYQILLEEKKIIGNSHQSKTERNMLY